MYVFVRITKCNAIFTKLMEIHKNKKICYNLICTSFLQQPYDIVSELTSCKLNDT